jgi:hypothetical protein
MNFALNKTFMLSLMMTLYLIYGKNSGFAAKRYQTKAGPYSQQVQPEWFL